MSGFIDLILHKEHRPGSGGLRPRLQSRFESPSLTAEMHPATPADSAPPEGTVHPPPDETVRAEPAETVQPPDPAHGSPEGRMQPGPVPARQDAGRPGETEVQDFTTSAPTAPSGAPPRTVPAESGSDRPREPVAAHPSPASRPGPPATQRKEEARPEDDRADGFPAPASMGPSGSAPRAAPAEPVPGAPYRPAAAVPHSPFRPGPPATQRKEKAGAGVGRAQEAPTSASSEPSGPPPRTASAETRRAAPFEPAAPQPIAGRPARTQAAERDTPTIRVTIGRIEVRATVPSPTQAPKRPERRRPALSLDQYLQRRNGGGR